MDARLLLAALVALVSCLSTGCSMWPFFRSSGTNAPIVFEQSPGVTQIVEAVNANSSKVHQLESQVRVSVDGYPGIRGDLTLEKPQRLRLRANVLGMSGNGIDVGSNDDLFWVWIKSSLPGWESGIAFANHEEFARSPMMQTIPIEPAWVRDALGITELNPYATYQGPYVRKDGSYELRYEIATAGQPLTRVMVVDPKHAWITEQAILDSTGRPILIAKSQRYEYYEEAGVSLPHRVELVVSPGTQQEANLTLDASRFVVNQIFGDPDKLWRMPQPPGVPVYNLAQQIPPPGATGAPTLGNSTPLPSLPVNSGDRRIVQGRRRPLFRGQLLR